MSRWPLIGRDSELQAFTRAWAQRQCHGIVICGPAGVGKSRLAEECLARAARQGWRTRRVTASAAAAQVPLGAIAHLIPPGTDLSDPVKGFATVATALAGPQHDSHWAIWVDDLHQIDATSAVLLRQLLDARVIRLIATVRTGESLAEAVDALTSNDQVQRIELATFNQQQAQAVLDAALGGPVSRRTLQQLYAASGGNALYLHELVLGVLASGELASDGEIWELTGERPAGTPKLAELITARLATARPTARPVLDLLSLAEPLSLAEAQQVTPPDVLAELEQAGLIQVTTSRRRTTLQLAHPLYGETLRAHIPALRQRTLLQQQANRTQAHGARRHNDPLRLATWQLAATGTADPQLLIQAAGLARHAHDYQQAVTLLEALPEPHHTTDSKVLLGEAYYELGQVELAQSFLAKAADSAATDGDRLAIAMEHCQTLLWGAARIDEALAVNDAARADITDPGMRHALTINEGAMRVTAGQLQNGLDLLTDVEAFPEERVRLYGMALKAYALTCKGQTTRATRLAEHAYAEHVQADTRIVNQHSLSQIGPLSYAYQELGELRRARQVAEQGFTTALQIRAWQPAPGPASMLGRTLWLAGYATEARRAYAECVALIRDRHAIPALMRLATSGLAASSALLGDLDTAESTLEDMAKHPDIAFFPGEDRLGHAWLLAARGRLAEARNILAAAAQTAYQTGSLASEALLLTDVARLGGAKDVQHRLNEIAEQCDGAFAPARAHLAAALAADDPDQLLAAADEMEAIGADLIAAEAATQAARAWQRTGHARKAAAATQQAQACAARCPGVRTPLLTIAQTAAALTAREKEIALLAAAGTASKDIANTLHLSVRTVDNHLQHAYTKLGVTTRRELAHALGTTPTRRPV
ncbi:LuxR C-terminal-related transcriptional regulator [Streptomyces sp. SKN60]|nr:LuxR C-terminal-related transcriptional regulator [Streptomyces sp. SKN60]